MNQELYDSIYFSLTGMIDTETEEKRRFINDIALLATAGAQEYIYELEEAMDHLKETIKRLSKDFS